MAAQFKNGEKAVILVPCTIVRATGEVCEEHGDPTYLIEFHNDGDSWGGVVCERNLRPKETN